MKTMIVCITIASCIFLAGCTSSTYDRGKPNSEYPEAWEWSECLDRRARQFAQAEGSPLELGIVAAAGCKHHRRELAVAMSGGSRAFVEQFVRSGERTDAKLAAERIIKIRG